MGDLFYSEKISLFRKEAPMVGLFFLYFLLIVPGIHCASTPRERIEGREEKVQASVKKPPEWTTKRFFEEDEFYFFVGKERSKDLSLGENGAKLQAMTNLASAFESVVTAELRRGKGEVPAGLVGFIKDFARLAVDNVPVQGAVVVESYWEKVERVTYNRAEYFYDVWVLMRIHKDDFQKGMSMALEKVRSDPKYQTKDVLESLKTLEEALTPPSLKPSPTPEKPQP